MNKKILKISIIFLLFFIANSPNLLAKEVFVKDKVVDLKIEMNINTDSTIDINESFSINASENLKEYIVKRSFPLEYNGRKIEIKNIKVSENNKDIITKEIRKDRNVIVNLSNTELSTGIYTYNIKYKIRDLIEFEKDNCKIDWHLFSDSFGIPVNNYNLKINFPDGTQIVKEDIKINDITNELELEKNNLSIKLDSKRVEIIDNSLVYPGTDIILKCEFKNNQIARSNFLDNVGKILNRNTISIIILVLSSALFIFQNNNKIQMGVNMKKLVTLAAIIFIFILAILLGMTIDYNITANYVKNIFIKFSYLLLFEGFILLMTYFIIKYEIFEKNILSKIIGICIIVSIVSVGLIFVTNFLEDIYYNMFGYLVLLFVLISNVIYFYKIKSENYN